MKIYKLEIFRYVELLGYVRLPFVAFGTFLGSKKDDKGDIKARFDKAIKKL